MPKMLSFYSTSMFLMIDGGKLAELLNSVFPVISLLQNKIQLAFRQLNAFNVKLQLWEVLSLRLQLTLHCRHELISG